MATYDEVMTALRNADAAGAADDAAQLAKIASALRPQAPAQEPVSRTEQMVGLGSPIARFAKGAIVDPLLGVNQLLAQTGLFGEDIKRGATQNVQQYEQATQKARERVGSEGFDWVQLGGAIASPTSRIMPTAAPTALGRIEQAVGAGGLMAAAQPLVDAENFVMDKIKQMGFGAVAGALVSGGVEVGSKVASVVKDLAQPLSESGRMEALRKYVNQLVSGDKKDEVIAALRSAPELVPGSRPTAAEAVSQIPEAASLAAYQKNLSKDQALGIANRFSARTAEQEAARLATVGQVAQTPEALAAARVSRESLTRPMREDVLAQANVAGNVVPKLEDEIATKFAEKVQSMRTGGSLGTTASQEAERLKTFYPVSGMPRLPGSYRPAEDFAQVEANLAGVRDAGDMAAIKQAQIDFKRAQIDSVSQNGFYKLESSPIIQKIDSIVNTPGLRTSDVVKNAMSDIRDKLASVTNQNGVIDSRDLYSIRKDVGAVISNRAKEAGTWDEKLVGKLDKNVKSYIDNAIIQASEGAQGKAQGPTMPLWDKYLRTYQNESDKINRMEIGQALEQKLQTPLGDKERVGAFATAMQNVAQTIKTSTGSSRYTKLDDILSPQEVTSLNMVTQDLARKAKAEELALKSRAGRQVETGELPNFLNRAASVTNLVLRAVRQDANQKINKIASEMLLHPSQLAAFMEGIPAKHTDTVVKAFLSKLTPELRDQFTRQMVIQGAIGAKNQNQSMPEDQNVEQSPFAPPKQQSFNTTSGKLSATYPALMSVKVGTAGRYNPEHPIAQMVMQEADKQGLGEFKDILVRQAYQESRFDPTARSNKNARGVMQIIPGTARDLGLKNPYNPDENIRAGVTYMKQLLTKYNNNPELALAAYNWGPGRVDKQGMEKMPSETRKYLRNILGKE
jgi:hypothetical protein